MSDFQIIRTVEALEALDLDTLLVSGESVVKDQWFWFADYTCSEDIFPLAIIATGSQVRAAREAMEQDNE